MTTFTLRGGRPEVLRFLGQVRPHRLLERADLTNLGMLKAKEHVAVEDAEFVGEQTVVGLITDTGTLIAEGYAHHNSEYAEQRNCCEFWLGVAKGRGVKLYIPPTSDLLKCVGQYGFDDAGNEFSQKVTERLAWLHRQDNEQRALLRNLDAQQREGEKAVAYQTGVIRALEVATGKLGEDGAEVGAVKDVLDQDLKGAHETDNDYRRKLRELAQKKTEVEVNLHTLRGAIQDCTFWKRSWAVPAASDGRQGPHVDRSQDARTGIQPGQALAPAGDSKPAARAEVVAAAKEA